MLYFFFLIQQKRCQKQTPRTQHMQHDIVESTSRTQKPTLPELAVAGTRPLQIPPVSIHPYHHSPSIILSVVTNLQGWAWCGETKCPLSPLPSIHPHVQETEIQRRESQERKEGWRTHCFTSLSLEVLRFCKWK